jgi:AcrR family transcriptional regulator
MSTGYEEGGRAAQKERTRAALIAAARDLIAAGARPTIASVAAAAGISRQTAYRYFSSERALLVAAHPEISASTMLPDDPPEGTAERLDAVLQRFTAMVVDTERQQRTMLRLSLEEGDAHEALSLRQGRAIGWIAEALAEADHLSDHERHQLVLAVRATTGIEALVWLEDVGGLCAEDATALVRWSAQARLERSRSHPPPVPSARRRAAPRRRPS